MEVFGSEVLTGWSLFQFQGFKREGPQNKKIKKERTCENAFLSVPAHKIYLREKLCPSNTSLLQASQPRFFIWPVLFSNCVPVM